MLSVSDKLSDEDAIGIGRKGTIDKPQLLKAPFWTVDTLFYMTTKEKGDLLFCYSLANKLNWKKYEESTGVPSLSKSSIVKIPISIPTLLEQSKIGQLFKQLEYTIALHQRKLELLEQLKQGYLENMFPQQGENVSRLKLTNFDGEWEQHKLGEITKGFSGGTPSANNKDYYNGSIPFIRSGEINSNVTELFITNEALNNSSAKLVAKGDILYALYGATSGEVGISQINGAINQAVLAIRPKFGDDSFLIAEFLKKKKQTIIGTYLQGGQGNLSGSIVKNLIIALPKNKEEQSKISLFLKQIDKTIALYETKLEKLQSLKKAYLQKMFV